MSSAASSRATARQLPTQDYLASVSDLMAGSLYVFIIAVMVFAIRLLDARGEAEKAQQESASLQRIQKSMIAEQKRINRSLQEQKARRETAIKEQVGRLESVNEQLRAADESRTELLKRVGDALAKRGVEVSVDPVHGLVRLPEEVLFESGTDTFVPGGEAAVAALASSLRVTLPCFTAQETVPPVEPCQRRAYGATLDAVVIEGHTDDRPKRADGRFRDNWDLSAARAIHTYNVLVRFQPDLKLLLNKKKEPILGVAGYADSRRVDPDTTEVARSRNRRIDIRFLMSAPPLDIQDALRRSETGRDR